MSINRLILNFCIGQFCPTASMPCQVINACRLLAASFTLGLLALPSILLDFPDSEQNTLMSFLAVFIVLYGVFVTLLVIKLCAGRNWARWATALLVVIGIYMIIESLADNWQKHRFLAVMDMVSIAIEVVAVWLLFAAQSNQWFSSQTMEHAALNAAPKKSLVNTLATAFAIECPHCHKKIPFFSKIVHSWGKSKICPFCQEAIRQSLAHKEFFVLAFAIGLPIKLLGVFVPALAFLKGSLSSGLLVGVLIMLCLRFERGQS